MASRVVAKGRFREEAETDPEAVVVLTVMAVAATAPEAAAKDCAVIVAASPVGAAETL